MPSRLCWWASISAHPVLALCHRSTQCLGNNYLTRSFPKPLCQHRLLEETWQGPGTVLNSVRFPQGHRWNFGSNSNSRVSHEVASMSQFLGVVTRGPLAAAEASDTGAL